MSSADKDGHGLNNMESRIYLLNGKSELNSSIGSGTELDMKIPLTEEDMMKLNANS